MKVALRQLRTENKHLQTRVRGNTVSHFQGSEQQYSMIKQQSAEQALSPLQQMPDAFRIPLQEKERKNAATRTADGSDWLQKLRSTLAEHQASFLSRAPLHSAGDGAKLHTNQTLAPPKKRLGVDRAHPLEPITVRKIQNNTGKEAELCQPRPPLLSSQPMACPEADRLGSRRGQYVAWSIDSMGDNIRNFCKDLLLKAKAREAKHKVTEMSEILYYEGPERLQLHSHTDDNTNSESRAPKSHTTESIPESTQGTCIKRRSRLPYLKRVWTRVNPINSPQDHTHQDTPAPKLLTPDEQNRKPRRHRRRQGVRETGSNHQQSYEQKHTKSHLKRAQKSAQNPVSETPSTCEPKDDPPCPRRLLPLVKTCIPQGQSTDKPPQAPGHCGRYQEQQRPLSKPQLALDHTFQLLGSDNWEKKMEGLARIRRLAQWHSDVLVARLHDVCWAIAQEVQNLRSQVARAAVVTLGDLYLHLQRTMDAELDWTAKSLLQKAGESNKFIRQDVDVALGHMLRSCTPASSMKALLNGGLRHHNVAVRECAACHLEALVDSMGTARLLCCKKDIMNNFLSAVSRLPQDSSQEVRRCGQHIMGILTAHRDFHKKMKLFP
ncbi:hypothetical protein SKAU_G00149520 [Synaphobranchus kaupii]|uniref:CLASP N-terminal domain-containing protein n=1 Tax=Synaphobranchus kaupii TaxID=118154 RepID=A0A9Q1FUI5_SYNKA|nr:hypothetical protein SKAU_G00149520 [Synaphobranchus kaupii]